MSKPFDIESAKRGAPVQTLNGRKVRLFCFDLKTSAEPVIAGCILNNGCESLQTWALDGSYMMNGERHYLNLVMAGDNHETA